jgi:3-oxoacyl-[acyl-carrier-protein] synthase III
MPTITNADVEAEARALLRDRIARLPWHAGLPLEERERRIAEDVDTYWLTLVNEAVERLLDRAGATLKDA